MDGRWNQQLYYAADNEADSVQPRSHARVYFQRRDRAGPVHSRPENLWRLVAQEDTDGDQKITVHDHTTPFEIRDESGADVRAVTNEYQLSVLMQELKAADNQHQETIAMDDLRLNENIVDRTHRFIKDQILGRADPAH